MKNVYLLIIGCFLQLISTAQEGYWQQQVNFTIDVRLSDSSRSIDGFAKIEYINNSPDTLRFIWFHVWPNAYKNDKTAFSDQLLENGNKDFYFSDNSQRGYINRLDFRVEGTRATMEDHPQHIDIIKVILPHPLAPGGTVHLETPFHVKMPHVFSRSGYVDGAYQVTQWYPKPAVYDAKGWHPMPYLDQGEFYSEFGDYDVRITVPVKFDVASTGELKKEESAGGYKTVQYVQDRVHDFAWFADKFSDVQQDTILLPSGRVIKAFCYNNSKDFKVNAMKYLKDAVHFRSAFIGEYPYSTVKVVQGRGDGEGGMEYPTITVIASEASGKALDFLIEHEVGHNWFYAILASNERQHPWMDEGMNSYYDKRYLKQKYGSVNTGLLESTLGKNFITRRLPDDEMQFALDAVYAVKNDQPVSTSSEEFTDYNYNTIAYLGTARWMEILEGSKGPGEFDKAMKAYYEQWKFKHPSPEDFRKTIESSMNIDTRFYFDGKLNKTNEASIYNDHRKPRVVFLGSAKDYKNYHYIGVLPAIGGNKYDKFMIGLGIHNYSLPLNRFRFALFPLYATGSKQFNGIGKVSYTWFPDKKIHSIQVGVNGSRFSSMSGVDSTGSNVFGRFYKVVPFIKLTFNNKRARNSEAWWLEFRSFQIGESDFDYPLYTGDSTYLPVEAPTETRYLNQLTLGVDNNRVLYPYEGQLQFQQAKDFYRFNFTGNYFFNYPRGGGVNVRLFAAKFGYLGNPNSIEQLNTERFQPKLTAVRGDEDYTYGNYFVGRTEHEGFGSSQIMMRDGGLKLRTDLFQGLQGRSENWAASVNLNTTLPNKLFPIKLPIKLFLDFGTYAEAWKKDATTSRFLYVGGLQLSIFNNFLNIYAPVIFSKEFRDNLKTIPEDYKFFKRMSFSIDIQRLSTRKTFRGIPIF